MTYFGPLHGYAFLAYVVVTIATAILLRWRWWAALIALVAAIPPPVMTIVAEIWIRRTGRLDPTRLHPPIHPTV